MNINICVVVHMNVVQVLETYMSKNTIYPLKKFREDSTSSLVKKKWNKVLKINKTTEKEQSSFCLLIRGKVHIYTPFSLIRLQFNRLPFLVKRWIKLFDMFHKLL